jgi:ribosomal subunit interface protein
MQLEIVSRHFTLGEEQKAAIEANLEKLEKFSPRPVEELKVTITRESGHFDADGVLYLKATEFRAKGEGMEPEYAMNEFIESLRKQLSKFKGKVSGKQKGKDGGLSEIMMGEEAALLASDVPVEGFIMKDMDVKTAMDNFQDEGGPFLVFRNVDNAKVGVIYRRSNGDLGHMESHND